MGFRSRISRCLRSCFSPVDDDENQQSSPPVPVRVVPGKLTNQRVIAPDINHVRFSPGPSLPHWSELAAPVNLCEAVDDLDNDCIRISERATTNAQLLSDLLELVYDHVDLCPNPVTQDPQNPEDNVTYELE
jgi:hypothetical protein